MNVLIQKMENSDVCLTHRQMIFLQRTKSTFWLHAKSINMTDVAPIFLLEWTIVQHHLSSKINLSLKSSTILKVKTVFLT